MKSKREKLFSGLAKRIKGIVLAKDQVIPYKGVLEALGRKTAEATVQLIDFPFPIHTRTRSPPLTQRMPHR